MKFTINPKLFNPLYWHVISLLQDLSIRFIFVEGGSSASKTFTICQAFLIEALQNKKSTVVFRRFHVHIKDSVYASFKTAAGMMELTRYFIFQHDKITCKLNGAVIIFKGLDNEENIKGIEGFDYIYNNEWNQFELAQWKQQRKRLRGKPGQKFVCDWNPVSAKLWIYEDWIDLEDWSDMPLSINAPSRYNTLEPEYAFKKMNAVGNAVNIKVTYRDNFWVVGRPDGQTGFVDIETIRDFELDKERDSAQYRIYANGERGVIKTGGEFWKQFNADKHIGHFTYKAAPIHVSLDENGLPYITISIWQVFGKEIRMIHEIACKPPKNNVVKAANLFIEWMQEIGHEDMVFVYGDPSSTKHSTVDENSRSFYDKWFSILANNRYQAVNRVVKSAPQVSLSAAFINEIYENNIFGYSILINSTCKVAIDDYLTVKEGPDGDMTKPKFKNKETEQTYEKNGHFSDAKRYFLIKLLEAHWNEWRKRKPNLSIQTGYLR